MDRGDHQKWGAPKVPFFSIVIPVYNRANGINKTLQSVKSQVFGDFEVIVVDDGSTDNLRSLVEKETGDLRIQYVYQENAERGAARNTGIRHSMGKYVTFLDSDDILYPNHLETAHEKLMKFEFPQFYHQNYEIRDEEMRLIHKGRHLTGDLNRQILTGNFLSCLGVFVKSEIIKQNLFCEDRDISGSEDWELWMRLACNYQLYRSNMVTACLIQHSGRSVLQIVPEKLILRIYKAYDYAVSNPHFLVKYGKYKRLVRAHKECYISLHLILADYRRLGFVHLYKAIGNHPIVLLHRKSVVIILKLLKLY